ncbi:MAG: heme exporter protein CcmD [Pseudomonadota bacterium]
MIDDPYVWYVVAAYGATTLVIGWLVVATLTANARARRALDEADRK